MKQFAKVVIFTILTNEVCIWQQEKAIQTRLSICFARYHLGGNLVHLLDNRYQPVVLFPEPLLPALVICDIEARVGNGISFRKIPRNRLGTESVIPRKKVLIPTEFQVPRKSLFRARKGAEQNGIPRKKRVFRNSQNIFKKWFVLTPNVVVSDTIFEICSCRRILCWSTLQSVPGGLFLAHVAQK